MGCSRLVPRTGCARPSLTTVGRTLSQYLPLPSLCTPVIKKVGYTLSFRYALICCTWVYFDCLWVMTLRTSVHLPSCTRILSCYHRMRLSTACYWLYHVGGMRMMSAHRLMPWRTASSLIFSRSRLPASSTFRDLRQVLVEARLTHNMYTYFKD